VKRGATSSGNHSKADPSTTVFRMTGPERILVRMTRFAGKTAVLGTKHGKERVIRPILVDTLGLRVVTAESFDSDVFGTFTREVGRAGTAHETVRAKALAALEAMPTAAFAIASEGSFGPHPEIPFAAAGLELVMLIARDDTLALMGTDLTLETNYSGCMIGSHTAARTFVERVGFPAHGVITMRVRDGAPSGDMITKDITDVDAVLREVDRLVRADGAAWIETDMRADRNPTRMRSIERATAALALAAVSVCPRCDSPGFVVVDVRRGLACHDCGLPTSRPRAQILRCSGCRHVEERPIDGPRTASAATCDHCNP